MRKLWIVLGVLLGLPVVVIAIAAFNLNSFLEQNRGLVEDRAEAALGRDVKIGAIRVGFADGLSIRVEDVGIGDDPAFSTQDFLSTQAVDVGIRIWPALQGKIEVSQISLRSPTIRVIQRADGLSIDSLGGGEKESAESEAPGTSPAFLVSLLQIEDGRLIYIDESARPPATFEIGELDVESSDLSLERPIVFELSAVLLGASGSNLTGSGSVGPLSDASPALDARFEISPLPLAPLVALPALASSLPEGLFLAGDGDIEVRLSGTTAELDFDLDVDLESADLRFGESFRSPKGTPLRLQAEGQRSGDTIRFRALDLTLADTRLAGKGSVQTGAETRADLRFTSPAIHLAALGAGDPAASQPEVLRAATLDTKLFLPKAGPDLTASFRSSDGVVRDAPYTNLALDARFAKDRLTIDDLSLNAFDGKLSANGSYDMKNAERPSFQLKSRLEGMKLATILASQAPSVANLISGRLEAGVALDGFGSAWEQIRQNLSGTGEVQVEDGVIRDFNPAGSTMQALLGLPFLAGSKLRALFDAYPKLFGVEDTPFDILGGHFTIRDGWVETKDLALDAGEYSLSGTGRYALDNRVDFKTVFAFSDPLSQELLAAEPKLRFLRGPTGKVSVPVAIKGAPPRISALPDVEAIARSGGGEAIVDLLGKALGAKKPQATGTESPGAPASEPAPNAAPAPRVEDVGAELLGRGLGKILGGGKSDSGKE